MSGQLTWPHVPVRSGGVRFGHQSKLGPLYAWSGLRPLAVLDDEFGGKTRSPPSSAPPRAPTLLRPVNPHRGLCRDDVDAVLAWLYQL